MTGVQCFLQACVLYCQQLVATPDGRVKYTDPYPVKIDYKCLESEIQEDMGW